MAGTNLVFLNGAGAPVPTVGVPPIGIGVWGTNLVGLTGVGATVDGDKVEMGLSSTPPERGWRVHDRLESTPRLGGSRSRARLTSSSRATRSQPLQ